MGIQGRKNTRTKRDWQADKKERKKKQERERERERECGNACIHTRKPTQVDSQTHLGFESGALLHAELEIHAVIPEHGEHRVRLKVGRQGILMCSKWTSQQGVSTHSETQTQTDFGQRHKHKHAPARPSSRLTQNTSPRCARSSTGVSWTQENVQRGILKAQTTRTHTSAHAHTQVHKHTHTHRHTHTRTHKRAHTHTHRCTELAVTMHAHAQVCTCAWAGAEPLTQDAVQEGAESRCCGHEADGDVFADAVAFDLQCILGTRLSTPRLGPNTCKCVGMRVRMCMHAFIHSCVHVCVVSRCVVLCITPFKHHPLCAPCLSLLLSLPLSASLDLSRPLSTSLSVKARSWADLI